MTTYFKDSADGVYAVGGDVPDSFRRGVTEITKQEYDAIIAATTPPPTPAQIAAAAQAAKDTADTAAAKADAKLQAFAAMSPAQIRAWVAANVTNLATASDALATLAVAVSILARRL